MALSTIRGMQWPTPLALAVFPVLSYMSVRLAVPGLKASCAVSQ